LKISLSRLSRNEELIVNGIRNENFVAFQRLARMCGLRPVFWVKAHWQVAWL
jgi:hypothetical protein